MRQLALRCRYHPCNRRLRLQFSSLTSVLNPDSPENTVPLEDASIAENSLELDPS